MPGQGAVGPWLPAGSRAGELLAGQRSLRTRQDGVLNWDMWESCGSKMLPMNISKIDCCYLEEQVSLSLWEALGTFARVAC